ISRLWVGVIAYKVHIKDDHYTDIATLRRLNSSLGNPLRLLCYGSIRRPVETTRKSTITLWGQVTNLGEAGLHAGEWPQRTSQHAIEVVCRVSTARVAAALGRANNAFVIVQTNAVHILSCT